MEQHEKINDTPNFMTYTGNHLFHYTTFTSAIKIISSKKLLFGDFKNMNDISESRREVYDEVATEELYKYKSLSFTLDKYTKRGFEIDSLWGYYAEKGNGMCLVFNKSKLITQFKKMDGFKRYGGIKYIKNFTNAVFFNKNKEPIIKQIEKNYKDIFFTKSIDWRNENEYRLLIRTESERKVSLSFGDALVAIVICMPLVCNIKTTSEYNILKTITNVPVLRYHTSLGNKTLTEIEGTQLWPLLGTDIFLDTNCRTRQKN